ncbi:MAG: glycine--tRNA ligase subunit beta [Snowella sp.]|nr:glycine--tRNA ligase subunit beta [Snowella sp.]
MANVTFLLEIGTEELPADFVANAIAQWQSLIPASLAENLLTPQGIQVFGTPRRLALLIQGLPSQQPDREEAIKGPPAGAAFKDGQPTNAAIGFAKKQDVDINALEIRATDKGDFVFVQKKTPGRPAQEILSELVLNWINRLEGRRFMRWGDGDLRFPRPIRWLVALLDDQVLPLQLVNGSTTLNSDRVSRGHRVLHPEAISIPNAAAYQDSLRSSYVIVDPPERRQIIEQQIHEKAKSLDGKAEIYPDLLAEVVNLVEYPTAVIGQFDTDFLKLPTEVITTVMVTHQRYFPIKKVDGSLFPNFITIANGDPSKASLIAEGNARVIRARLADAQFFYQADCDQPLESYLPQLETVTFQEELGTMRDKVDRIMEVAQQVAEQLNLGEQDRQEIESTALLCKADLVTQMVYEFPELQGIMGQKYALVSGESKAVSDGIFEHYLPRNIEDSLPETLTGRVVGISDRLDTLVSIFGLGLLPTGSSDPFALRRAANAIINITWSANLGINLEQLLSQGSADFVTAHPDKESPFELLKNFFIQRIKTLLEDELKIDYDLVNAVLGENDSDYTQRALENLLDVRDRAQFLQSIRNNGQLEQIYETVNRSARLASKGDLNTQSLDPQTVINPDLLIKSSEKAFYQALTAIVPITETAQRDRNYQNLVNGLADIAPTVANFFDGEDSVLVMDENLEIRQNRLNLLGLLRNHARVLADFGSIVKG